MKNILLANIGNRNIKYKGNFIDTNRFRELTEIYLDNFEIEKDNLSIEIISPFFTAYEIESVHLFYSDTPEPYRNNQDTVYEAEIIKRLIETSSEIQVTLHPLKCRVVDSDALMKRYRGYLRKIAQNDPQADFLVCDAGGTAQQKSALKVLINFMWPDTSYQLVNVIQGEGGVSKLEPTQTEEYRRVIVQEQVGSLIDVGNYEGAASLLGIETRQDLIKMIDIAFLLINNNYVAAEKEKDKFGKKLKNYPAFRDLFKESNPYPEQLEEAHFQKLFLILSIAQFYRHTHKAEFAVLYYSIFIENFCDYSFETSYDLDFQSNWDKIKKGIENKEILYNDHTGLELRAYNASLPVKVQLCSAFLTGELSEIISKYKHFNSYFLLQNRNRRVGLDSVRNKFAHEGKQVSDADFKALLPFFDFLETTFLKGKANLFHRLNEDIHAVMR